MDVILNSTSPAKLNSLDCSSHDNVVFYDESLQDVDLLLSHLNVGFRAVPVGKKEDFIDVLACNISTSSINHVHVLAHGQAGKVNIGKHQLNNNIINSISQRILDQINIEAISFLSCNVGKDINFIKNFSKIFDCRVNFSKDLVGHKSLGGTWDFDTYKFAESAANNIVSFSGKDFLFSDKGLEKWEHTLAITIDAGQVQAYIDSTDRANDFTGYATNDTVTITGNITLAQAILLDAIAASKYIANISTGTVADLVTLTTNRGVNTNEFDITVTDTTASASDLNTINTKTASAVSLGNVTTVTGARTDLATLYGANGSTVTGLGNEAITVTDANITSAQANTIDA